MIMFIRKWNVALLAAILVVAVVAVGLLGQNWREAQTVSIPSFGKRVIVDAGHGFPDGGAVGELGIQEKDLNLKIAQYLQEFLEQSGTDVILTRSDDNGIYDVESGNIKSKKRSDMFSREKIINQSDADAFVSIHMNKFTDAQYSGPQVFFSKNNAESKPFAQIVQQKLISTLEPESHREIKQANNDIYLLKKAKIPAVLIECGFLSNAKEEKLLVSDEYQRQVAWAIYGGIIEYFAGR